MTDSPFEFDDLPAFSGEGIDPFAPKETLRAFGEYVLLARLAQGGMGELFIARHPQIDTPLVIKVLRQEAAEQAALRARFKNEAALVAPMHHPGLCRVVDAGDVNGTPFIAFDYIAGRPLSRLCDVLSQRRRILPRALTFYLVDALLDTLSYVHHFSLMDRKIPFNIVHRDVSPNNIMVGVDGHVHLIDFGLAQSSLDNDIHDRIFGKIAYMPPEQARHGRVDARADQFAIAAVLLELLTAERLYPGLTHEQVAGLDDTFLPPALAALAPGLRAVVAQALDRRVERRFVDCAAFRVALQNEAPSPTMGASELAAVMQGVLSADVAMIQNQLERFASQPAQPPHG